MSQHRQDTVSDDVREMLHAARRAAPERIGAWAVEVAQLVAVDPRVAPIAGLLAEPLPSEDDDD